MKLLRLYIDTSVVGGCLDAQFAKDSLALLDRARRGEIRLVASELLRIELSFAPAKILAKLDAIPREHIEEVEITDEAERLREAYLIAKVVGRASRTDALHVALAAVNHADAIISWNFRHIVQFEKIRGFNAVNVREGYPPMEIRSPKEFAL